MRWFWIDKFLEFEHGVRAVAVKNVALVEEEMDDYNPGFPVMPPPLIIEGLAQTAGLLVGECNGFEERVVLAKVGKAVFHFPARPGDTLTYTTVLETVQPDGAFAVCTSHVGDRLQAEVELFFAHLDDRFGDVSLFEPGEFLCMLRMLGIYDVGRMPDGSPLQPPAYYLEAEQKLNASGMAR